MREDDDAQDFEELSDPDDALLDDDDFAREGEGDDAGPSMRMEGDDRDF